ncbi:hypothetical protein, partial [Flavobacterium sp. AJR]|uniref:hypothetical protein n=1 Tax=Flavobacterium sp. AJR TaxID=1979369 RepID=UPI000B68ED73
SPKIEVEPVSICKGGSGLLSAKSAAYPVTEFMGLWNIERDPRAFVPYAPEDDMYTCKFSIKGKNQYTATKFTVSASGEYNFKMEDRPEYFGSAYIYSGDFTPGYCDRGGEWIVGLRNDDNNEPEFKANLVAGKEYTLISVLTLIHGVTNVWDYTWRVESPKEGGEFLLDDIIYWYKSSSGGEPLGWGPTFNPVGVAGSGLADTNTPGTTTYYASYASAGDSYRFAVDFVIKEVAVAGVASSTPTLCGKDVMDDITHTTIDATGIEGNGVNGANGLPDGVQATWEANTITISGNPRELGVFNYKIPLIAECGNVFAEGKITILPKPQAIVTTVSICSGESYTWAVNGEQYTTDTALTIINDGCTADEVLDLKVTPKPQAIVTTVSICSGESYTWAVNGEQYTADTALTITNDGCTADQVLDLKVTPKPQAIVTTVSICSGESYTWAVNGEQYTTDTALT